MTLFWFHATNRPSPAEFVQLLNVGLRPAPFVTQTQQLELRLGITPNRVYCHLGRALEGFGDYGVALNPEGLPVGELSPFDSGGLIRKSPPVCEWPEEEKQAYLRAFSFSTLGRKECLDRYPNTAVIEYLRAQRPVARGPHEIWEGTPQADIWALASDDDWRSWTWEGRWTELPIAGHIVAWTCAPSMFPDILDAVEAEDVPHDVIGAFLQAYHPGGVGALVADMQEVQSR